jgi:hypothetical protein
MGMYRFCFFSDVNDLEQTSHISRMALDDEESADEMQSSDSSRSRSESSASSTSSSGSSSESTDSTSSSGSEGFMSVDGTDTDEERTILMGMTADLLVLRVITETRVLNPNLVAKCSQLDLILVDFRFHDPKRFRHNLRVSASTFDHLLEMIKTHPIFLNDTNNSQGPVSKQLAIAMFRFGHNGNAASVEAVAQWAGVSGGTIVNCTRRVIIAFLALHDSAVRWPSEDEKEKSKEWVEMVSCYAWRDGFCMVDGTPIVLFQKPGYHGEAYFDRKSNYSLNLQVRFTLFYVHVSAMILIAHYPAQSLHNRLCNRALW